MEQVAHVFVVDDYEDILVSIRRTLESAGFAVSTFGSATEFIRVAHPSAPCCILLDVDLPHMSGLELQQRLIQASEVAPIVFMSGLRDVPATIQALKSGAVDFLLKPFSDETLLKAVEQAVQRSLALDKRRRDTVTARERMAALTPREREVTLLVAEGLTSREIAARLGTAESTVALHRAHMMTKLQAESVADVVRLVGLAMPETAG